MCEVEFIMTNLFHTNVWGEREKGRERNLLVEPRTFHKGKLGGSKLLPDANERSLMRPFKTERKYYAFLIGFSHCTGEKILSESVTKRIFTKRTTSHYTTSLPDYKFTFIPIKY